MNSSFESEIDCCVACLQSGGVLLYPTDTIWGLGCDPSNTTAVRKLFELKGRPKDKSLILLANSPHQVEQTVGEIPASAYIQMEIAADHPITIIYPQSVGLADGVSAADGSIAIRIPKDAFCQALIEKFGRPITSTSANLSGQPFPKNFDEIAPSILNDATYVVKWRREVEILSSPSRIVKLMPDGNVLVIRR